MKPSRLLGTLLLAATLTASGCTLFGGSRPLKSVPEGTEPFKVLCWNLEHFVDPFDDPYVKNDREDQPRVKSAATLTLLARAIVQADADVMAFQEAEGDRAVKGFLDAYVPEHGYKYFACVPATDWYQNVVVASRFPLGEITSLREVEIVNESTGEKRNNINNRLMTVEVRPSEDYSFLLAVVHLKAGGEENDRIWRSEQIEILKELLEDRVEADSDLNILLVGDMNHIPTQTEFLEMTTVSEPVLASVFAEVGYPPTHPSDKPTRHIDMILTNPAMQREYVPNSAVVALPLSQSQLSAISDHLPVMASFYPVER